MKILLVDDDEALTELLVASLSRQQYVVDVAFDGETGWDYCNAFDYDLLVLDVMLPKLDGVSFCRRLRDRGYQKPILLLTARNTRADKVMGLDAGADDYVVKPFDVEEFAARIRALLRREGAAVSPLLSWGDLRLNLNSHEVTYGEKLLRLTPKEYGILELLLRHQSQVFSPAAILENLWSMAECPGEDTVRSHIKGLRRKLKVAGADNCIETVYGLGYRLHGLSEEPAPQNKQAQHAQAENQSQTKPPVSNPPNPSQNTQPGAQANISAPPNASTLAAVDKIWEKFKDKMLKRVECLEQAAIALRNGQLNWQLQQQAQAEAHKLAGSLGNFGRTKGSQLAQALETLWQAEQLLEREQAQQVGELTVSLRCELGKPPDWQDPAEKDRESLLLLIVDRSEFTQQLIAEAADWGMRTAIASDFASTRALIHQERPDAVLLQLSFSRTEAIQRISSHTGLALAREIANQTPPIPVLVVAEGGSFADRIEVIRHLGLATFITKPITPSPVLDAVTQLVRRSRVDAKVMAVSDDPQLLAALKETLASWPFQLETLDNPEQFWQRLDKAQPDLLILDIEIPRVNGLQLCQVLRRDLQWCHLSIFLLADRMDAELLEQAFRIGADDCIRKSVVGVELANRILNCLERQQR